MENITRPNYHGRITELPFEELHEVMYWMSRNIVHELATSENFAKDRNELFDGLAKDLNVAADDVFYGLQYAKEMGYVNVQEMGDLVELTSQPDIRAMVARISEVQGLSEGSLLDKIIERIAGRQDREVEVKELYVSWPEEFGVSEIELREAVMDGVVDRKLAIAGLTGLIKVPANNITTNATDTFD